MMSKSGYPPDIIDIIFDGQAGSASLMRRAKKSPACRPGRRLERTASGTVLVLHPAVEAYSLTHRCRAARSTQGWVAREPGPHHQPRRASPPLQMFCRRRRIATWKVVGRLLTGMAVSGSGSLLLLQLTIAPSGSANCKQKMPLFFRSPRTNRPLRLSGK